MEGAGKKREERRKEKNGLLGRELFQVLMVILQTNGLSLGWPKKNEFRAVLHGLCLSKSDGLIACIPLSSCSSHLDLSLSLKT